MDSMFLHGLAACVREGSVDVATEHVWVKACRRVAAGGGDLRRPVQPHFNQPRLESLNTALLILSYSLHRFGPCYVSKNTLAGLFLPSAFNMSWGRM